MSRRIVFIGAGNLATRLSSELQKKGHVIQQVYSHTRASAEKLAQSLQCAWTTSPKNIHQEADIYFVALKDSIVNEVLSAASFGNALVVHCSGSLPLSVLSPYSTNRGVFYPLQTFSKNREVNFEIIPVFIEANSPENETILLQLASNLSEKVSLLNSDKRLHLHISAVFACNFVNHLYVLASEVLKSDNIPFDVLHPLIQETASKVMNMDPFEAQTGPAVRFDRNIIDKHLKALESFPELKNLYQSLSESIYNYHKQIS